MSRRKISPVPKDQPPSKGTLAAEKAHRTRKRMKLQADLESASEQLQRWQRRLKRAFNATDKLSQKIRRINRELQRMEEET
jgi:uncharacterized membrane-anchored protein YhcB (DUF1043 family)